MNSGARLERPLSAHLTDRAAKTENRINGDMKSVEVDLSDCKLCEVCVAACPDVFRINDPGYVEVADLDDYPEAEVQDAIKNCPTDCISWSPG